MACNGSYEPSESKYTLWNIYSITEPYISSLLVWAHHGASWQWVINETYYFWGRGSMCGICSLWNSIHGNLNLLNSMKGEVIFWRLHTNSLTLSTLFYTMIHDGIKPTETDIVVKTTCLWLHKHFWSLCCDMRACTNTADKFIMELLHQYGHLVTHRRHAFVCVNYCTMHPISPVWSGHIYYDHDQTGGIVFVPISHQCAWYGLYH